MFARNIKPIATLKIDLLMHVYKEAMPLQDIQMQKNILHSLEWNLLQCSP